MNVGKDKRLTFDLSPEIYDRARPEYPKQVFNDLLSYLREKLPKPALRAVEIGPGTGQATKVLIERGMDITAVEVGPQLSDYLAKKFAAEPQLHVLNTPFEDADLRAQGFDLVLAATAWHWLDATLRLRKATDLLRPDGVLASISTIQIQSEADRGFFDRTFSIYKRFRPDETQKPAPKEAEATPAEYNEFLSSDQLGDVTQRSYRWDQTYSTDEYEDLLRSYSDVLSMEQVAREGLISDLRAVIDQEFNGVVVRPLVIALTMGRKKS